MDVFFEIFEKYMLLFYQKNHRISENLLSEGRLMNRICLEKGGVGVFRENFEKYHGNFSYFISGRSENFSKKRGWGLFGKNFEKHHGTFCSFILRGGGWVVNLKNFEKLACAPSKKYLHPVAMAG